MKNASKTRRRRRPTLWDVREPPYGIPIPARAQHHGPPRLRNEPSNINPFQPRSIPGPNDIVRAPLPSETGPLAGINIDALRALLNPRAANKPHIPAPTADTSMQSTRHARRLYVGNLPSDTTEIQIEDFFNRALQASHGVESPGNPVISVYTNLDKRFAFIETRTVREAAAGLSLDGVKFRDVFLRLRRPNDYNPSLAPNPRPPDGFNPSILGIVSTQVSDGPSKVFIGGIPYSLSEDQIKNLLSSYGPLAAFNLIKDPTSGMSKGFAFFEFADPSVVDSACEGLHGMQVADKTLTVRRASQTNVATHASGARTDSYSAPSGPVGGSQLLTVATCVVELCDILTPGELEDDEEYQEIMEDMEDEGAKFGKLVKIVIPRPSGNKDDDMRKGVGKVFLKYGTAEEAERAHTTLDGRKFSEQTVRANFFDEGRFDAGDFS